MDFVDRTLHLHDTSSNIQKFSLETNEDMSASRVHSWISSITRRGVEELTLCLHLDKPFYIPVSLFTCESLTKLYVGASCPIHFPKSFSFLKLKSLELRGIPFADDNCWNEQNFPNFPVLEKLILSKCTWLGEGKFCIFSPALKDLEICSSYGEDSGLHNCYLKIYAPSLVSLNYSDVVAKDYDLSIFLTLETAEVGFTESDDDARSKQGIGYGAAVTKFLQAISHVLSLSIDTYRLQILLDEEDFMNDLPTFHNLKELYLYLVKGEATDELVFALLEAAPNLNSLDFGDGTVLEDLDYDCYDDDEDLVYDGTEELFQHLYSVRFSLFSGEARDMRWAKFILMNAKSLHTMTFVYSTFYSHEKTKEEVVSELSRITRASERCVFEFV